jgi:predicted nuclease of predicted toxin-antitoxin system
MQLLCDEGVDRQIVERLREEGHTVSYVAEMDPGVADTPILEQARSGQAVLVTADKDFGDLVFREEHATAGVVLLRSSGLSPEKKAALTASAFARHADEMTDAFSVVSPGGVRTRSKP